jgi:hypothetical protein
MSAVDGSTAIMENPVQRRHERGDRVGHMPGRLRTLTEVRAVFVAIGKPLFDQTWGAVRTTEA